MPADGVLDFDLDCLRVSLRMSLPADGATAVAPAIAAVSVVRAAPEGPQAIPFACAQVPMPAGGVR